VLDKQPEGRYMWPAACASVSPRGLLAARRRPRRALNVAITADYWSGVASTMERRRLS
jgi:hypothetical protein